MPEFGPGIVFTILAITIGITAFSFIRSRHLERMAMIEKGIALDQPSPRFSLPFGFRIGMLFFGIGIGIFMGYLADEVWGMRDDAVYPAFIFLCAGLSLVGSYIYEFRMIKSNNSYA